MNTIRGNKGGHMTDILFTLALFCVFAASSLMVVLIGANVYQSTIESQNQNFSSCTSVSYVSTKIRQHDSEGAVYLDKLGDLDALVLEQYANGTTYQTWIYHYNGALCELMSQSDNIAELTPSSGQEIVQISGFNIERVGSNMLRLASLDEYGKTVEVIVGLRT